MGKHIIRLSRWSTRSLYQIYSRLITLIFALFCSVTGQVQKSASMKANGSTTTFKGTAYRSTDSTLLKNIQFYLRDCIIAKYGIMPEYGILMPDYGVAARYGVDTTLATVKTDANGQFEVNLTASEDLSCTISSDDVIEPAGKAKYYSSGCLTIKAGVDTTYTLYLYSQATSITPVQTAAKHQFTLSAIQGKDFHFQIPDWKGQKITASILNSNGQKIAFLTSDAEGAVSWNTRSVAAGVYFLNLQNNINTLSMKILVK
ncbi:MAG TPA: T9SS type A sorting domain-containing protein [Chitinispirillaceae bacterium]|nr:T9SS type A sorting domain-containing protein [Chitinispirillaceae bacterium]